MDMSTEIALIAAALAKAQGEMRGAVKDAANPFFKSKYADLSSVWEACREPLSKNGIAVVQSPSADGSRVSVETLLTHTSGQWLRGVATACAKDDTPQSVGSAITYLRRYALQSFAGVAPEDDDAEAAQGRGSTGKTQQAAPVVAPEGYVKWLNGLPGIANKGMAALKAEWEAAKPDFRLHLTSTDAKHWEGLKALAAKVDAKSADLTRAASLKQPVTA